MMHLRVASRATNQFEVKPFDVMTHAQMIGIGVTASVCFQNMQIKCQLPV